VSSAWFESRVTSGHITAGVFTGKSAATQRDKFLKLRCQGLTRAEAMERVGTDKPSALDWDKGIRPFYGGSRLSRGSHGQVSKCARYWR
jgi:hypothetical protein